MGKRWVLKEQGEAVKIEELAATINTDHYLSNLLVQRKISNFDEAKNFFRPDINSLHDPFLMKDMDKAVDRLSKAIQNKEKILVYGDYDVDGTTAVATVYLFLKELIDDIGFYVPNRYSEGYGVSFQGIDYAVENNYSLIIALDCGIKALEKVKYATEKGVDFIICDHHFPGENIPDACAVLDPKRFDCSYPFKGLSGCGVGFKLIQGYANSHNIPFSQIEQLLDLVVISIASDIVPITGENRILAFHGLRLINTKPRTGIEAILKYTSLNKNIIVSPKEEELEETYNEIDNTQKRELYFTRELTISDLVFLIGPRINAAGRIENALNSVELLICDNDEKAKVLSAQINEYNNERKEKDYKTYQEALTMIEGDLAMKSAKCTVVYSPDWHQGVLGIVASRLTETYYRPTIVLTESGDNLTGSARSIKGFDIYEAVDHCSDLLEHFGGHTYAAGLSLKKEQFEQFKEKFTAFVNERITPEILTPEIEIDMKIKLDNVSPKFFRILKQFAPFGPGNMAPVFQTDEVIDRGFGRAVGNNGNHLKLDIIDKDRKGNSFPAIAFQLGNMLNDIQKEVPFSICYTFEENEWNGNVTLQLNIKDIIINKEQINDYNQ
ncbi:MAG: DHHA1 domain-containing protein [Bacteroidales bacterium]|nr:DHHA1 domain-containing protein [Bacteroidales bacterium]